MSKIGSSDFYFVVNKERPDLLGELNRALSTIQDEDPYYNQRLSDEYFQLTKTNAFLTPSLEGWLAAHGTIRVGYWDNYLPFCDADKTTGELTGAFKDYLAHAANCLKNAAVSFEAVPYPSTDAAFEAMKRGEIDCFADFVTTKHFETPGELFFDSGTTALIPINGDDVYYTPEQAANFDAVFGLNTSYVIDPEECMADNFSFAMVYGLDGPGGEGYPTPEIIEGILACLRAQ